MNELKLETAKQEALPRRRFIRHFVLGTAVSTIVGREWIAMVLADCQPTTPTGGMLRIKISDFPALQSENGSVRLALNPFTMNGPSGFFYPVLVNRGSGDQFFALRSRCTHQFCVVPTFNASLGASVCPCHQSRFRIDGTVIPGSQAVSSLERYTVSLNDVDLICIEIPSLQYVLTATAVQSGVGPRVRLQFQTRAGVKYEVRFRQSASEPGIVSLFSTTEGGAATASVLTGNGGIGTMYIERTSEAGFYSVAVKVTQG
jgi:Rieske Fe-S protein